MTSAPSRIATLLLLSLLPAHPLVRAESCIAPRLEALFPGVKVQRSDPWNFRVIDVDSKGTRVSPPKFHFTAWVGGSTLHVDVRSIDDKGLRSRSIRAGKLFDEMMQHFASEGTRLSSIRGDWSYGSNLKTVNELTSSGLSLKQAASRTWTGEQAARHGYTEVRVVQTQGEPGEYKSVLIDFARPRKQRKAP